jgi:hypothetical protein
MSAPLPRVQGGAVLTGVKATPSGWPPASPDPSSGRRPQAATGSGIQQNQVSTVSGDCHLAIAAVLVGVAVVVAAAQGRTTVAIDISLGRKP